MADGIIRVRITKAAVDHMEPGQVLRDVELKGFGVRRQQDVPSYFLQRKINGRLLVTISEGVDPQHKRQQERDKPTLNESAELFMASHGLKLKPRTREEYQRLFDLHIAPALGRTLVADIKKADIARLHAAMAATPSGANFALAVLSKLMRWCEDMGCLL
ncbi:MAG: hypothetical protein ABL897_11985, partial [Hyphomicrobium sp.]